MGNHENGSPPRAAEAVVVIGASAGGLEVLKEIAASLPADLPAAVCVVLHVPTWAESRLPAILQRGGNLEAHHAVDGEPLVSGRLFVAPPGSHLTLDDGRVRLSAGPKENGHRPAIDPLFRSAALAFGARAVGVLLSGASDDGSAGLAAVKASRGVVIVQDPDEALYPTMPRSALASLDVDLVLPASQIGHAIAKTASRLAEEGRKASHPAAQSNGAPDPGEEPGEPRPGVVSPFTCPECGGTLWENADPLRADYECRVGHAFSLEALSEAQILALEAAMWSGLRALEESIALSERIAQRSRARGNIPTAERYERRAALFTSQAREIRRVVLGIESQEKDLTR